MSEDEHLDSEFYPDELHKSHKETVKTQCYWVTDKFMKTAKRKLRVP